MSDAADDLEMFADAAEEERYLGEPMTKDYREMSVDDLETGANRVFRDVGVHIKACADELDRRVRGAEEERAMRVDAERRLLKLRDENETVWKANKDLRETVAASNPPHFPLGLAEGCECYGCTRKLLEASELEVERLSERQAPRCSPSWEEVRKCFIAAEPYSQSRYEALCAKQPKAVTFEQAWEAITESGSLTVPGTCVNKNSAYARWIAAGLPADAVEVDADEAAFEKWYESLSHGPSGPYTTKAESRDAWNAALKHARGTD